MTDQVGSAPFAVIDGFTIPGLPGMEQVEQAEVTLESEMAWLIADTERKQTTEHRRLWERAERFDRIHAMFDRSDQWIADGLSPHESMERAYVNKLRLVWQRFAGYKSSTLSFRHLRTALPWDNAEEYLDRAIQERWSSREMESQYCADVGLDAAESADAQPTESLGSDYDNGDLNEPEPAEHSSPGQQPVATTTVVTEAGDPVPTEESDTSLSEPPAASSPAEPEPPPPRLDNVRRPVPEKYVVQYETGRAVTQMIRELGAFRARMDEFEQQEGAEFAAIAQAKVHLRNAQSAFKCTVYYSDCPRCGETVNTSCTLCSGAGWIPNGRKGYLSDHDRQAMGLD